MCKVAKNGTSQDHWSKCYAAQLENTHTVPQDFYIIVNRALSHSHSSNPACFRAAQTSQGANNPKQKLQFKLGKRSIMFSPAFISFWQHTLS